MSRLLHHSLTGLFFCAIGSVCAGPALGQTQGGGASGDDEVIELFDPQEEAAAQQRVEVGSFGQIDLQVKDLDVTDVLRLLSMQSKKNIIASRNVSGKVSANLFGVDFYQALDAILQPNGFGYREQGDFIYVYTADELAEIEKAARKRITEVIRLNYLNGEDAQTIVAPLVSEDGEVAISAQAEAGFQPSLSDGGADSYAGTPALVVTDYEENVEQILGLLAQLDTRPEQVLIEATVLSATLTEDNAFGIDFSIFADVDVANFTNPLNAVDELISGSAGNSGSVVQSTVGSDTVTESGFKLGFLGSNFSVFVEALDSVTDATVLSVPKILTLNRQKAELLVGRRLGFLNTTVTDTSSTQTVEFIEDGTQLTVRPFVSDDGFVRLELRPSVSTASTDRVVEGNVIPEETTSELVTNVIVRSGQTLVLGGLFTEDTSISRNQVPGIGNIPVVGAPFRGQDDNVTRSEIIFLIKPTVLKDNSLYAAGEKIESEIADLRAGMRQGLLPWSRTKLTQSYMKRALELLNEGDEDHALWNLNLALAIDPTATDALELRSRLTGQQVYLRDPTLWGRAVSDSIDAHMRDVLPAGEAEIDLNPGVKAQPQPQPVRSTAAAPAASEPVVRQPAAPAAEAQAIAIVETTEAADAEPQADTADADLDAEPAMTFEPFEAEPRAEVEAEVETELAFVAVEADTDEAFDVDVEVDAEPAPRVEAEVSYGATYERSRPAPRVTASTTIEPLAGSPADVSGITTIITSPAEANAAGAYEPVPTRQTDSAFDVVTDESASADDWTGTTEERAFEAAIEAAADKLVDEGDADASLSEAPTE